MTAPFCPYDGMPDGDEQRRKDQWLGGRPKRRSTFIRPTRTSRKDMSPVIARLDRIAAEADVDESEVSA